MGQENFTHGNLPAAQRQQLEQKVAQWRRGFGGLDLRQQEQHKPEEQLVVREVQFTCAQRREAFTSVYRWNSKVRRWQLWETEHGTGSLYRGAYGQAAQDGRIIVVDPPEGQTFNNADFDWQFSCKWCRRRDGFHQCHNKHLFCKAGMDKQSKYDVCPVCGADGYYTENVTSVAGLAATFQVPQATIPARTLVAVRALQPISRPTLPPAPHQRQLGPGVMRQLLPPGKKG